MIVPRQISLRWQCQSPQRWRHHQSTRMVVSGRALINSWWILLSHHRTRSVRWWETILSNTNQKPSLASATLASSNSCGRLDPGLRPWSLETEPQPWFQILPHGRRGVTPPAATRPMLECSPSRLRFRRSTPLDSRDPFGFLGYIPPMLSDPSCAE